MNTKQLSMKTTDRLYSKLNKYSKENVYPFSMPGHKRNVDGFPGDLEAFVKDAYAVDITEIDGFDNLHDPQGVIKEAEENAAALYDSEETHFLVNGSSCGVLSAIFSVTNRGDKVIVARNCHKSVYNAILLRELSPVFIYPEISFGLSDTEELLSEGEYGQGEKGEISSGTEIGCGIAGSIFPEDVEKAIINNPDAKAVIITSPTYDGIISNVAEICKRAHEFDIPVIVDEAHGALFFMEGRSSVINGADIVINSVHKTLPALTGTAIIHANGHIVDRALLRKYLSIFQTSSPSYVLMGSIDFAMAVMEKDGRELYKNHCIRIVRLKEALKGLKRLHLFTRDDATVAGAFDFDESKVIISGIKGPLLGRMLISEYSLQPEMVTEKYVLFMLTVMDTDEGVERLIKALTDIDERIGRGELPCSGSFEGAGTGETGYVSMTGGAFNTGAGSGEDGPDRAKKTNTLTDILGNISDKTVFIYPPGIPIIFEGETVTEDVIKKIDQAINAGLDVKGL